MSRLLTSLIVAFLLFARPALCMGGFLPHECDCGHGEAELECHHEDSCPDDPCESLTVPHDRDARSLLDIDVSLVPVAVVTWHAEFGSAWWSRSAGPPLPPDRWKLPYAQSDRPMLI